MMLAILEKFRKAYHRRPKMLKRMCLGLFSEGLIGLSRETFLSSQDFVQRTRERERHFYIIVLWFSPSDMYFIQRNFSQNVRQTFYQNSNNSIRLKVRKTFQVKPRRHSNRGQIRIQTEGPIGFQIVQVAQIFSKQIGLQRPIRHLERPTKTRNRLTFQQKSSLDFSVMMDQSAFLFKARDASFKKRRYAFSLKGLMGILLK